MTRLSSLSRVGARLLPTLLACFDLRPCSCRSGLAGRETPSGFDTSLRCLPRLSARQKIPDDRRDWPRSHSRELSPICRFCRDNRIDSERAQTSGEKSPLPGPIFFYFFFFYYNFFNRFLVLAFFLRFLFLIHRTFINDALIFFLNKFFFLFEFSL